ncbi:MAG: DNA repair protein RecO [Anaerolineaceae bacterium]|nr:DNA repair protein RecO [Anaerolineaceae bacterium]
MPSAERTLRLEAIVLRHSNWGEADRLLVLFGREAGKVRAVAKGVRKMRSRKAGHLEPFTRVKLLLARGRDFWIVTQAETVDAYLPIRDDLVRTAYAAYVIELLDRFTYEEGQNRALYQILVDTMQLISMLPDPFPAVRYYEIRLLDLLGFRPELVNCVRCEVLIKPEDQYLDAGQGGILCPRCGDANSAARPISMTTLKFLRHYQRSTFREASRAPLTPVIKREMEALLSYYVTYWLERRLNSPAFLHEVRRDYEAS